MKMPAFLLGILAALPAWAQDETIGVRLREWYARINGEVFAEAEGFTATTVDLDRHLGLGQAEVAHEIQVSLSLPLLGNFTAGYWMAGYKGDRWLTETVTFGEETFSASTEVRSELELQVGYLSYEFVLPLPMPLGEAASFEAGVVVGARLVAASGSIENEFVTAEEHGEGGLPVVGAHAALQVTPWLRADVEVVGLTFRAADRRAFYVEAYGEVVARLGPLFGGVGYKYVEVEIRDESRSTEFRAEALLDGLFLTAGVRF